MIYLQEKAYSTYQPDKAFRKQDHGKMYLFKFEMQYIYQVSSSKFRITIWLNKYLNIYYNNNVTSSVRFKCTSSQKYQDEQIKMHLSALTLLNYILKMHLSALTLLNYITRYWDRYFP